MATIRKRLAEAKEAAELENTSENIDEENLPKSTLGNLKRKKKRRKWRKWVRVPDMTEWSLPKPRARLDTDLDLSESAVMGASQSTHALSRFGNVVLPVEALAGANGVTIKGFKPKRLKQPDDDRVAQYRVFYAKQLPSMPFIDDAYHLTFAHTGDGVTGGATFSFIDLTTHQGERLLILDVLSLAVKPGDTERRGVGTLLIKILKLLAQQEALALHARSLLLTQADLSCVGFWAKAGFARSLDVNALLRSLRRTSDATLFTGAVPMAHLMPKPLRRPTRAVTGPRLKALGDSRNECILEHARRPKTERLRIPLRINNQRMELYGSLSANGNLNNNSNTGGAAIPVRR